MVEGLLLARIPEEIAIQIDAYYKKQNEAKEEAVDNNLMKEQHPSMRFSKESNTRRKSLQKRKARIIW